MPATTKSTRVDEFRSKPSKIRIAAMRIVWGETPIVQPACRHQKPCKFKHDENVWLVPSEKTSARYTVNLTRKSCTCPFWRDRRKWCKHLEAARIWVAKIKGDEKAGRLAALIEAPSVYRQEPWYDALTSNEESIVRELARCLGAQFGVVRRADRKSNAGRKGYALGDVLACAVVSAYLNRPLRKSVPFHAVESGLVRGETAPSPPVLRAWTKRPEMLEAVRTALRETALCTSKIDTVFSIDGTVMKTPLGNATIDLHP